MPATIRSATALVVVALVVALAGLLVRSASADTAQRSYTATTNVQKAKHDAAMAAIQNTR